MPSGDSPYGMAVTVRANGDRPLPQIPLRSSGRRVAHWSGRVAWSHDIVDTFEADFLMDPALKEKTKGAKTVVGPLRLARKERLLGKGSLPVAAAKRLGVLDLPSKQNFAKCQRCRETVPVASATHFENTLLEVLQDSVPCLTEALRNQSAGDAAMAIDICFASEIIRA